MSQNDFFSFSLDSPDSDISEPDDQPPLKRPCLTAPAPKPKPKVNNPRDSINPTLHSDPQRDAFIKSLKCFRSTGGKNVWTEREKDAVALFFQVKLNPAYGDIKARCEEAGYIFAEDVYIRIYNKVKAATFLHLR